MQTAYHREPRLSRTEAADFLDVSVATLARWAAKGVGPDFIKIGHRVRYPLSALDSFLAARTFAGRRSFSGKPTR